MKKRDYAPMIALAGLTVIMFLVAILVKSKKILILTGVVYFVACNVIIAYKRWIRPIHIVISFVSLLLAWFFTWIFLKGIIGYDLMKILLIFNCGLYWLNALLTVVDFIIRKKRRLPQYISMAWFLLTTIIISYILYVYVFNFISMLSF
uniref:hypothetical protein n=1 Tax=Ezakiella massiliensis TaxID=1852374 RepID=UPI00094EF7AD|nr:hypothetical protein [Ezakiella massiliensis]